MNYEKPEVIVLENASKAIQSLSKNGMTVEIDLKPSLSAYEADE